MRHEFTEILIDVTKYGPTYGNHTHTYTVKEKRVDCSCGVRLYPNQIDSHKIDVLWNERTATSNERPSWAINDDPFKDRG
jgi:hypothetical protein